MNGRRRALAYLPGVGSDGLDVAMAIAGEPYHVNMPEVWGVELRGDLPEWCSAKDVILEMLRRHDIDDGAGHVIEYHGGKKTSVALLNSQKVTQTAC